MVAVRLCAVAAALALCLASCGKRTELPPNAGRPAAVAAAAQLPTAATPTAAAATDADKLKLATDFWTVRCQVVGYAAPAAQLYKDLGWASAAAFMEAFDAAAQADPAWARKALEDAYAKACPGGRPSPLAAEPTPPADAAPAPEKAP